MKRGSWVVVRYSSTHEKTFYPTDLSDAEWTYIEPHLPVPKGHGRPRIHSLREILDAIIFYVLKEVAASGAYSRTTFLDGPPSITTSENGA